MNALYDELRGRGFTLLLVNLGEDAEYVRQVVRARGYTAPVLLDEDRAVSAAYGVSATPTVFLLDRQLRIVGRAVGRRDWTGSVGRRLMEALLRPS